LGTPDAAGLDVRLGFHGPCPLFFSDRRSTSLVWAWKTREINHQPPKSQAHLAADSGMQELASLAPVVARCAAARHRVLAWRLASALATIEPCLDHCSDAPSCYLKRTGIAVWYRIPWNSVEAGARFRPGPMEWHGWSGSSIRCPRTLCADCSSSVSRRPGHAATHARGNIGGWDSFKNIIFSDAHALEQLQSLPEFHADSLRDLTAPWMQSAMAVSKSGLRRSGEVDRRCFPKLTQAV